MKMTIAVVGACSVLGLVHLGVFGQTIYIPQPEPYTNDAHTVLLEHFDRTTSGSPGGPVTYTNGMFNQGVHLGPLAYVRWDVGASPEATLEFWGKLDTIYLPATYWGEKGEGCFASSGYGPIETFFTAVANSNDVWTVWRFDGDTSIMTLGDARVTPNVWHHYATTWGSQGGRFYFDGALVDSATNIVAPPTNTWWGIGGQGSQVFGNPSGIIGVIDELRVSDVQRTFAPLPRPSLSIAVSKVKVTQYVVVGHTYVMDCSTDLDTWTQMGDQFTATTGSVTEEYDVDVVGRFFRIREVK